MSKLKLGAACAILVAGVTTTTVIHYRNSGSLHSETERLRQEAQENQRLREENQRLAVIKPNTEELGRLRSQHIELLQLRSQEGLFRAELAQAQVDLGQKSAAGRTNGKAVVRAVRGTAELLAPGGGWSVLPIGKVIAPTSQVKTGVDSQVDLFLGENGPTVRMLSDTTLALETLSIERTGGDVVVETRLDLKTGTIQGHPKARAERSNYEVKTPYSVCTIRGAEYQISANGTIHITKGSASVTYRDQFGTAHTHTVNSGETFVLPEHATPKPKP